MQMVISEKKVDAGCPYKWNLLKWVRGQWTTQECKGCLDYSERPTISATSTKWPNDDRINAIAQNGGDGLHYDEQREAEEKKKAVREIEARERQINTKYDRTIIGKYGSGKCVIDVYRVLNAFPTSSPEIDHSVKKLLAAGKRGAKDELQDLREAIQSIEARISYLNDTPA
jgi:hypothetical protein